MRRHPPTNLLSVMALVVFMAAGSGLQPAQAAANTPARSQFSFFSADEGGYRLFGSGASLTAQPDGLWLAVAGKDGLAKIRLTIAGANPRVELAPEMPLGGTFSDLRGDPSGWLLRQPIYGRLRWRDVLPGVDLVLEAASSAAGGLPVAWRLEAARAEHIDELVMQVEGALAARMDGGRLVLDTSVGELALSLPLNSAVAGKASLSPVAAGVYAVGIPLITGLNSWRTRPQHQEQGLQLLYASYLGGSSRDTAYALAVDSAGAVYLAGETPSADFPVTVSKVSQQSAQLDAFLVKLAPDGSGLEYAVLMGGGSLDTISALAVENGIAYVAGDTWSQNFPAGAIARGENDAWAAAVAPDGSGFVYGLRLGGSDQDRAHGLAVQAGEVTLTGVTWSPDFPAAGFVGSGDVFIVRLNQTGQVVSSVLYGGSDVDAAFGLSVRGSSIAVCGQTWSRNFTIRGWRGEADAFVLLLDENLRLIGGTVFGGPLEDSASACIFAEDGNIYAVGRSESADFPSDGASLKGGEDAFIAQVNASGLLESAVLIGGSSLDNASSIASAPDGSLWVGGRTNSADFPAPAGLLQFGSLGGMDAFSVRIQPGSLSGGSTQTILLGGSGEDRANALAVGPGGAIYLAGVTRSSDFPASEDALDGELSGIEDAFMVWLGLPGSQLAPTPTVQPPVPTATEGEALILVTEAAVTQPEIESTESGQPEETAGSSPQAGNTPTLPAAQTSDSESQNLPTEATGGQVEPTHTPASAAPDSERAFPWTGLLVSLAGAAALGAAAWIVIARRKKSKGFGNIKSN